MKCICDYEQTDNYHPVGCPLNPDTANCVENCYHNPARDYICCTGTREQPEEPDDWQCPHCGYWNYQLIGTAIRKADTE